MRVLVTGGAGFLGSHLVEALVWRGDEVVVIDNFRRGRPENVSSVRHEIALVEGDIRDEDSLRDCMDEIDTVFHLAAQSNVMGALDDLDYSISTNVSGTFNVVQAALDTGVRRVVFASSREVYGDPADLPVSEDAPLVPKNQYGAGKVAGEVYCETWQSSFGLECQVLRFANLFGPRDYDRVIPLWLERAAIGEELLLYGGEQVLDFLWVGQAVEALLAAADCDLTGPINVGSGRGVHLKDLAGRVIGEVGSASKVTLLPARDVEVTRFVANTARMQRVLGVFPEADPLHHLSEIAPCISSAKL